MVIEYLGSLRLIHQNIFAWIGIGGIVELVFEFMDDDVILNTIDARVLSENEVHQVVLLAVLDVVPIADRHARNDSC